MKFIAIPLKKYCMTSALAVGLALPTLIMAQSEASQNNADRSNPATNAQSGQKNPYKYPDDSFIRISGTVKSVSPDTFTLAFGGSGSADEIIVEMDDGDRDADAYVLLEGDKVTVTGLVDADLFQTRTIEASTVYVDKLQTHFYSSAVDEEDYAVMMPTIVTVSEPIVRVQGKVASVSDKELSLGDGSNTLTVDVSNLLNNPLDDEGYQKIEEGDVISVTGQVETGFMTERTLAADAIIEIHDRDDLSQEN